MPMDADKVACNTELAILRLVVNLSLSMATMPMVNVSPGLMDLGTMTCIEAVVPFSATGIGLIPIFLEPGTSTIKYLLVHCHVFVVSLKCFRFANALASNSPKGFSVIYGEEGCMCVSESIPFRGVMLDDLGIPLCWVAVVV